MSEQLTLGRGIDALIPADITEGGKFLVDARELHHTLGLTMDFSDWMKATIDRLRLAEGRDFSRSTGKTSAAGGRPPIEYRLTQSAAKRVQIAARGDAGDAAREGAVRLHDHVEAIKAPSEDQIVLLALEILQKRVAELQPRAEIADRLTRAEGDMSLWDAARRLGFGPQTFVRLLASEAILHGHKGDRRPRADLLKAGYFVVRSVVIGVDDDGCDLLRGQTMVTPAGLAWLAGRYERRDLLPAKSVRP